MEARVPSSEQTFYEPIVEEVHRRYSHSNALEDAADSRVVWVLSAVTFGLGNSFRVDGAPHELPLCASLQHRPGHSIASAGENYVSPVDIEEPCTVELAVKGVKRSEVFAIICATKR